MVPPLEATAGNSNPSSTMWYSKSSKNAVPGTGASVVGAVVVGAGVVGAGVVGEGVSTVGRIANTQHTDRTAGEAG